MARIRFLSLIDAARNFDPIAETRIESWIVRGDLVVMQGNLRPNVTRDCLALAKVERRNDGSQPVANLRGSGLRLDPG